MLCLFFVQMCLKLQTEKTCQKVLDKSKRQCYNMQAVHEEISTGGSRRQEPEKKLKKLLKNPLTNGKVCGIMSKHFRTEERAAKKLFKKF